MQLSRLLAKDPVFATFKIEHIIALTLAKRLLNMTIKTILACVILSFLGSHIIFCKEKNLKKSSKSTAKPINPCPGKLLKNMEESELEAMLPYGKAIQDKDLVLKTFFHLISQSKSQEKIKFYKIDFADYSFGIEDYDKALLAYEEFGILYPGSSEAEYAQYKAILCTFLLSLGFDKDQTNTQRTISMCLLFLQKAKNEKFITETKNIHTSCRQRLFDHEVYVLETYLKLNKTKSASKRIEYIEKEFTDIAHLAENVAYLKEAVKIVENPKTRPFNIQLNLKNALIKKEDRTSTSKLRRTTSFFLA